MRNYFLCIPIYPYIQIWHNDYKTGSNSLKYDTDRLIIMLDQWCFLGRGCFCSTSYYTLRPRKSTHREHHQYIFFLEIFGQEGSSLNGVHDTAAAVAIIIHQNSFSHLHRVSFFLLCKTVKVQARGKIFFYFLPRPTKIPRN